MEQIIFSNSLKEMDEFTYSIAEKHIEGFDLLDEILQVQILTAMTANYNTITEVIHEAVKN